MTCICEYVCLSDLYFQSFDPFYTPPHDSGGVLRFYIGRLCVCPSVSCTSTGPYFVSG